MANIYDMVSGRWQSGESEAPETASWLQPATAAVAAQLNDQTETVSNYVTMPADLSNMNIENFLQSQNP